MTFIPLEIDQVITHYESFRPFHKKVSSHIHRIKSKLFRGSAEGPEELVDYSSHFQSALSSLAPYLDFAGVRSLRMTSRAMREGCRAVLEMESQYTALFLKVMALNCWKKHSDTILEKTNPCGLVNFLLERGDFAQAKEVVKKIPLKHVEMRRHCCMELFYHYSKEGIPDEEVARSILLDPSLMPKQGVGIDFDLIYKLAENGAYEAVNFLIDCLELPDDQDDARVCLARFQFAHGNDQLAKSTLLAVVNPQKRLLLTPYICAVRVANGQFERAEAAAAQLVDLQLKERAYQLMAEEYLLLGQFDRAKTATGRITPEKVKQEIYSQMVKGYLAHGQIESATEILPQITLPAILKSANQLIAMAYAKMGEYERARMYWQLDSSSNGLRMEAYYHRIALLQVEEENSAAAMRTLKYTKKNPDLYQAGVEALVRLLARKRQFEEAESQIEKLPKDKERGYQILAAIHAGERDYFSCLKVMEKIPSVWTRMEAYLAAASEIKLS